MKIIDTCDADDEAEREPLNSSPEIKIPVYRKAGEQVKGSTIPLPKIETKKEKLKLKRPK